MKTKKKAEPRGGAAQPL